MNIDGTSYHESEAAITADGNSFIAGQLEQSVILDMEEGQHTVAIEWRKYGSFVEKWSCLPSFLDGYASS
eukprot:10149873-Ditylum_brightwellii.AAC.1